MPEFSPVLITATLSMYTHKSFLNDNFFNAFLNFIRNGILNYNHKKMRCYVLPTFIDLQYVSICVSIRNYLQLKALTHFAIK